MGYYSELIRAVLIKKTGRLLPKKARFRFYKALYDYQSDSVGGIRLTVPYLGDKSFFINTKDLIGWNIFFFGEYENATNIILRQYIKEGDTVLEAGANNGSETILISTLASKGKVFAFEPIPHIFRDLNFNIQLNKLNNIFPQQLAIGEINTTVTFHILPENYCNQGMSSKYGESKLTTPLEVSQVTLDQFVANENIQRIDFLKMDIQGAELDLIKGGHATLDKFRPIIFTEADDSWTNAVEIFRILTEKRYKIHKIEAGGKLAEISSPVEGNWLAIPSK